MAKQEEKTGEWVLTPERHYIKLQHGGTVEVHHFLLDDSSGELVFRACYQESDETHMPLGQCRTRLEAVSVANDFINMMEWI